MKKNDVLAFPSQSRTASGEVNSPDFGMTLRDYFAGEALIDMSTDYQSKPEQIAERCYSLADAMLAEREKE